GEVIGAVVVGAVAGRNPQPVSVVIGAHQVVRRGLAGGIGRVGRVRRALGECRILRRQGAVYLVGGDVVEVMRLRRLLVEPALLGGLQQGVSAHYIGVDEGIGAGNRAIDVAFSSKMHDCVDIVLLDQFLDQSLVTDIASYEMKALAVPDILQVPGIAGIGECVEGDDPVLRILAQPEMGEVGSNESGRAGDQYTSHGFSLPYQALGLVCMPLTFSGVRVDPARRAERRANAAGDSPAPAVFWTCPEHCRQGVWPEWEIFRWESDSRVSPCRAAPSAMPPPVSPPQNRTNSPPRRRSSAVVPKACRR